MLTLTNLSGFGGGRLTDSPDLYKILTALNATATCTHCVDCGNVSSFNTGGTSWTDLSGNARNYPLGNSTSPEGGDPTFNGTPGSYGTTNYWTFPGSAQYFWGTTPATSTYADTWHRAGGQWSFIAIYYQTSGVSRTRCVWSTKGTSTQGVQIRISTAPAMQISHGITNSTAQQTGSLSVPTDQWVVLGGSINDTSFDLSVNGSTQSLTGTASTATGSGTVYGIAFQDFNFTDQLQAGDRLMALATFTSPIGISTIQNVYRLIKSNRIPALL